MEIEKPVLKQPPTDLLKCYRELNFSSSLSLHHHPDMSKAEALKKADNMADNNNDDSVDSNDDGNDNNNDNSNGRNRSYLLLKKAKEDDDNDAKSSSTTIKQHFTGFANEQKEQATTTTMSDFDCPEFSSVHHRCSTVPVEISRRSHAFIACKLAQNSSDSGVSSNSIHSIQEEIPKVEREDSGSFQEKAKHLISSLYSSSLVRQHRRSATHTTTPSLVLQSSKIFDPIVPFGDDNLRIHSNNYDNGANNMGNQDRILEEKRPRIERPRARYPNSARRTSAPACLWSTSLFPDQQPNSLLHDNFLLLHKLLAKQRIMQDNVETFNFYPSTGIHGANDDIAATSQSETPPAIIPSHFPTTQTPTSPSVLASWQWLRG
ncbi:unnamed protein product [Cercopithifilaria johnstoni]|uniref:Uncharacterized protein n=1 Tax=Cercopithifilaria johnstoni TaxID=2874296 RepID=A0A8J2ME81_9BILA|nr:unnamed protein product [Cercopithifilaria johnstoni]